MQQIDMLKGAEAIVQNKVFRFSTAAILVVIAAFLAACGGPSSNSAGGTTTSPNETAATVNGKVITMQEVDRAVKLQTQGQESKLSQLELASARLQVLETMIQQEVMFQKAAKEGTIPSDDDVIVEVNKRKTASGKSADQLAKEMADQGVTEETLREQVKKEIATQKLVEKVTGKVGQPSDSEIEAFYNGNKEAFVKKKGVKLAAIVIDPANAGEGDQTIDEVSAVSKANEIVGKIKAGQDFASLAREYSEDQTRFQGGDLGYLAEEDMKQAFPEQTVAALMNPQLQIGGIISTRSQGKLFILKLQERSDKDEAVTLESPGVRQQVIESLSNSRKQLLAASYQSIAMNEAKIDNNLARKVVDNPNELSGARPAGAVKAPANTAATNANAAPANANAVSNANAKPAANAKPVANAPAKPAPTPAPKPPAKPANK